VPRLWIKGLQKSLFLILGRIREVGLGTNLADGLPQFADFLKDALVNVQAIRPCLR
jgi:hypothetical protein